MTTAGIEEGTCAIIMAIVAVAEVVGKAMLGIVGDHLPFPKIYLFVVASLLGVGVMFSLTYATTVAAMICIGIGEQHVCSFLSFFFRVLDLYIVPQSSLFYFPYYLLSLYS